MNTITPTGNERPVTLQDITVCPECDLVAATRPVEVPVGSQFVCPRCGCRLSAPKKSTVTRTLALSATALLLFPPAHFMLLLQLDAFGLFDRGTVFDSLAAMYDQGYFLVALMVLLTAMLIPLVKLSLLFVVSAGISRKIFCRQLHLLFRWYTHIEEWGMTEVYLIAILVTIIKMRSTADISYETGFFFFTALSLAMVGCIFTLDKEQYWRMIEKMQDAGKGGTSEDLPAPIRVRPLQQALHAGIIQCPTCRKTMRLTATEPGFAMHCPRCLGVVHERIPGSIHAAWALILSAVIFFFPANFLPIMQVDFLGTPENSTLLDGIEYFFQTGSYGIGLIIMTASILVPVFKVVGLSILLYSIHFNRWSRLKQKSFMFRFIRFIGRWSMLDIFVIALLCSLVDFGFFTSIAVAPASTFFTFVVITTMFAATSFDPRLLWDITAPQTAPPEE